jgi:hypothetical protein
MEYWGLQLLGVVSSRICLRECKAFVSYDAFLEREPRVVQRGISVHVACGDSDKDDRNHNISQIWNSVAVWLPRGRMLTL